MKGGEFLISPVADEPIFTPEQLTSEQKALGKTARDFVEKEVIPLNDRIETKEKNLISGLLKKAGGIGLLMAEIPEKFGGLGLGKIDSTIISENTSLQGSFQVTFLCHTGIGTLPIEYWGSDEQKAKYLPKLATGEMVGAYALTEANAGSDALAGRASAKLSDDGKFYILNGEKLYITNGGIADLITVFAKVDGKLTAFIVEKGFKGVSTGKEEKKMGLHGSSTVSLVLQDAVVPVENVLGALGKGHKIAFNTLNVGRWKLGAACVGACKRLIEISSKYAKERSQFGHPISAFELIREKFAQSAIKTFLLESVVYRYAGTLDLAHSKAKSQTEKVEQLEEFAIEASIAKILGSEVLQYVADESVQVHGGYGFCEDYKVERFYRDCRINRIFEGTNEINRMVIIGTLLKRGMAGSIDFMTEVGNIMGWLKNGFPKRSAKESLGPWKDACDQLKRLCVYVAAVGVQKYADKIAEQELIMAQIADMIIDAYAIDSGLNRALSSKNELFENMVKVYITERLPCHNAVARQILYNIAGGDEKEFVRYEKALSRVLPVVNYDTKKGKEKIAIDILK